MQKNKKDCVGCLLSDGDGEYNFYEFILFWYKYQILLKSIIFENPKINGNAKRLGQTIHKILRITLNNLSLVIQIWPQDTLSVN